MRKGSPQSFWAEVEKTDGCWLWRAALSTNGYGQTSRDGVQIRAHRLAWELERGPIPVGLLVLHRCDVPTCVNPDHLFLGTNKDNSRDMAAKGRDGNQHKAKTHCAKGHPYSGHNLIVSAKGWRYCRICRNAHARAQKAAKRSRRAA